VLTQYYDAVEEEIDIEKQFGTYCDTEMLHRDEVIRALVLVCDMAHVNPSLIAESLHRAETTIKFDHDAHCFICNDPRHDYYKKLYQQTPGTLCHDDKRSREFFKSLGLEYPEGA
jgi:hypothetical protein